MNISHILFGIFSIVSAYAYILLNMRIKSLEREVKFLFELEKAQDAINKMLLRRMKELEKDD